VSLAAGFARNPFLALLCVSLCPLCLCGRLENQTQRHREGLESAEPGEPFLFFAADKTDPGAYNLPLYLAFAGPMNRRCPPIEPM
jgi:hypothetical protein